MKLANRAAASILAVLLLLSLVACGDTADSAPEKSLYEQGLDMVDLMAEMAGSEEYLAAYFASQDLIAVIDEMAQGDYSEPKAVYTISPTDTFYASFLEMAAFQDLSEPLKKATEDKALSAIMTQVNAMGGTSVLAATAACTASKTFVCSKAEENIIYLYTYENACPVSVSFVVGEGGAVSAAGTFVAFEDFTCGSADEIKTFFGEYELEVTEIKQ